MSQPIFDVIVSLLESQIDLHIIYNKQFPDISQHDGFSIKGRTKAYQLPRKNHISNIMLTVIFRSEL